MQHLPFLPVGIHTCCCAGLIKTSCSVGSISLGLSLCLSVQHLLTVTEHAALLVGCLPHDVRRLLLDESTTISTEHERLRCIFIWAHT